MDGTNGNIMDTSSELVVTLSIDFIEYLGELGYKSGNEITEQVFHIVSDMTPYPCRTLSDIEPILESLFATNQQQHQDFHKDMVYFFQTYGRTVVDDHTASYLRDLSTQNVAISERIDNVSKKRQKAYERIQNLKEKIKNDTPPIKEKTKKSYEQAFADIQVEFEEISKNIPGVDIVKRIPELSSGSQTANEEELDIAINSLKECAKHALRHKEGKQLLDIIGQQVSILNTLKKKSKKGFSQELHEATNTLLSLQKEEERIREDKQEIEKRFQTQIRDIQKQQKEKKHRDWVIRKQESKSHRQTFGSSHAFVQSAFIGDSILGTKFQNLTKNDKIKIHEYIWANARKFRTKMARNVRTGAKKLLDISETCKYACKTGGIPIRLLNIKPKPSKSRLVLFLDVSGSCRNASEMMLIFMHEMREAFPGGCLTYVFTNKLYDVSDIFRESMDAQSSVETILNKVPRAGAYSNYEKPFQEFCQKYMSFLTKDSLVFFIGDARNNKNPSGEEYVKAITRKAKKSFWMNTESAEKWNQGDSIFDTYAQYMSHVAQTTTTGELIGFLQNVR